MALNKFMHPRNIYKLPPDFKQLAVQFPEFGKHVIYDANGKAHINFKDPNALRSLTETLLRKDFDLIVEIPQNHLIPTVPQRLNYILWIEDLLKILPKSEKCICGIDIGTGPCCIFPLLGAQKNKWKFLATETEEESFIWACKNVEINDLQDRIQLMQTNPDTLLKGIIDNKEETFDFCLCNPPFFQDQDEARQKQKFKNSYHNRIRNEVNEKEVIVSGGEVQFVKKLIEESFHCKQKIKIYTSMLGKKKSLIHIKNEMRKYDEIRFTHTEFCQGKTMRWGIAWTFLKYVDFAQVLRTKHKKVKPPLFFTIPSNIKEVQYSITGLLDKIKKILEEIKVEHKVIQLSEKSVELCMKSNVNTWSHQRRKRREMLRNKETGHSSCESNLSQLIKNEISVQTSSSSSEDKCTVADGHIHTENTHEKVQAYLETKYPASDLSNSKKDQEASSYNLCSAEHLNARNNAKRKQEETENIQSAKHFKGELCENIVYDCKDSDISCETNANLSSEESNQSLCCNLQLKLVGKIIVLKLECEEDASRESMHQVFQLLKNRLK